MDGKKKNILIGLLIIGIISMTVAYATLSQQLNINGSARVQARSDTWNIHFERVTPTSGEISIPSGKYTSVPSNSVITLDTPKTTATLPTVTFKAPGDTIEFYLDIVNEGEVTGVIDVINGLTIPAPTGSTASDIEYFTGKVQSTMEYTNPQGTIALNDTIAQNETKHLKITLTLDQNVNMLPGSEITYSNITASIIYVQGTASNNGGGSGSGSGGNEIPTYVYANDYENAHITSASAGSEEKPTDISYLRYGLNNNQLITPPSVCINDVTIYGHGEICLTYGSNNFESNTSLIKEFFNLDDSDIENCGDFCEFTSERSFFSDGYMYLEALSNGFVEADGSYDNTFYCTVEDADTYYCDGQ